jgi:hypothetical protein
LAYQYEETGNPLEFRVTQASYVQLANAEDRASEIAAFFRPNLQDQQIQLSDT